MKNNIPLYCTVSALLSTLTTIVMLNVLGILEIDSLLIIFMTMFTIIMFFGVFLGMTFKWMDTKTNKKKMVIDN